MTTGRLSLSLVLAVAAAATAAAQGEIYLEITQPGLRRVAVAAPSLMVLPRTPADVAMSTSAWKYSGTPGSPGAPKLMFRTATCLSAA